MRRRNSKPLKKRGRELDQVTDFGLMKFFEIP
jgi:hypothetical protein